MGLLTMSFRGVLKGVRQRGEVEELKLFDQQVRSRVLRHGASLDVEFDLGDKWLAVSTGAGATDSSSMSIPLESVTKIWMASRSKAQGLELRYDQFGCESYGVRRSTDAGETWTICFGTTGQFLVDVSDEELTSLKEILK